MENNGKGIFYGVIGVATLIVAIIGATSAFFSASIDAEDDEFRGETLNLANALSVSVTKVDLGGEADSTNLVPADFGALTPSEVDLTDVQAALAKDCVDKGYTGCHVWKVEATTTQAVTNASILLDLSVTANEETANKNQWGYAVYSHTTGSDPVTYGDGSDATALAVVPEGKAAIGALSANLVDLDIHNAGSLEASVTYYVMVFVNNVGSSQNEVGSADNATGSYQGAVTFQAGDGEVKASFAA